MNTIFDIYDKYKKPIDELIKINPELGNFYKGEFLKTEAKKRGYKKGVKCSFGRFNEVRELKSNDIFWKYGYLSCRVCEVTANIIFKNGKWDEIIHEEKTTISKEKALKIIAKKLKVSPENIIIE